MNSCLRHTIAALVVFLVAAIFSSPAVHAHEVRPAFLSVTERPDGLYDVLWKQPSLGASLVRLVPHISGGLLDRPPSAIETASNFQIHIWRDINPGLGGLEDRQLDIEGLDRTITDVLVSITPANGDTIQEILRPQSPSLVFHLQHKGVAVPAYIMLGIKHILTGADHLSFVLGLLLLVKSRLMLLKTITAFTVAHSITLAAATLHIVSVRPPIIEVLVALSILFVAVEVVHYYRGRSGLTVSYPWLIAFTFGLLHGFAFASALTEIGLPPNAVPMSLLMFNVGVEIGQLMFLSGLLAIAWTLSRLPRSLPTWMRWLPPYAIGTFAAVWFIERVHVALA